MGLVHSLRLAARGLGLEVHRYNPKQSLDARFFHLLKVHQVDGVFDIGANDGGYGRYLRRGGFAGKIISFEPLQDAHAALTRASENDPNWSVAPIGALGAEPGSLMIHVAGNSKSSSLLPMLDSHVNAAPHSAPIGSREVAVRRLDDLNLVEASGLKRLLLKIDTQGYEMPVLLGAQETLTRCIGVQLEMSLVPLYLGQALYRELTDWLNGRGFELWGLLPGFVDPNSGRLLQVDGIFFKKA